MIVLSQVLYWLDVKATYEVVKPPAVPTEETYYGGSSEPVDVGPTEPCRRRAKAVTETATVKGLLTGEGVRFLFTSFVSNFRNFSAMAIMLVVMIGVGLAEAAGLISSLIRKLVGVSSRGTLTLIIVFSASLSSVASDAGYLVLIPLGPRPSRASAGTRWPGSPPRSPGSPPASASTSSSRRSTAC